MMDLIDHLDKQQNYYAHQPKTSIAQRFNIVNGDCIFRARNFSGGAVSFDT